MLKNPNFISLDAMSNIAWLMLDLERLGSAYRAIVSGRKFSNDALKAFCDAISFTAFQYEGHSMRVPGRFDDIAPDFLTLVDQVLEFGTSASGDSQTRDRLLARIGEHREKIASVYEASRGRPVAGGLFCEATSAGV